MLIVTFGDNIGLPPQWQQQCQWWGGQRWQPEGMKWWNVPKKVSSDSYETLGSDSDWSH